MLSLGHISLKFSAMLLTFISDPESLTTLSTQKEEKNTNADDKDKTGEEDNFGKSLKCLCFITQEISINAF